MQKFKKWLLCIFAFLISLTMFGCAKVNFETRLTSSGAITTKVNIQLDGFSTSQKAHVFKILSAYIDQLDEAYVENLVDLYSNVYDFAALDTTEGKTEFDTIEEKYVYIISQMPSKFLIQDTDDISQGEQNTLIKINKNFASIYAYVLYSYPSAFEYNPEKKAVVITDSYQSMVDVPFGGTFEEDESLFVTKYIQSCHPLYYDGKAPAFLKDAKITGLVEEIKKGDTLTEVLAREIGITEEEVDMVFNFSTPYRRMHSNGEISQTENGYTHTWKLNGVDSKITFWRTYANSPAWYITAAGAGILVLIVGFIVVAVIKIRKKRQGMKALKQIDALARKQESNDK